MLGHEANKTGRQRRTNTEPGAVATGSNLRYRNRSMPARLRKQRVRQRGSPNTEPGAVATGFNLQYTIVQCQRGCVSKEFGNVGRQIRNREQ
jgi:hypothetical protein